MTQLPPLPQPMLDDHVRLALREDLGRRGDITSAALIPSQAVWHADFVARGAGVVAGLPVAQRVFALLDPSVQFDCLAQDGASVKPGDRLAKVKGSAQSLLQGERVALNYLSHLSGIASLTRRFVQAAQPHAARLCCTRKTNPGLRLFEKYAVTAGGGVNHRFGLDDAVLIKDNHLAVVGDIRLAVETARRAVGHMVRLEVEVDRLDQLAAVMDLPVDAVLLDNMNCADMAEAVRRVAGRFVLEASGGVTLETVQAIAATGVDVISVGALTHSAPILDIALDFSVAVQTA